MQVPLDEPISTNSELFDYMRGVSAVPFNTIVSRIFHVVQSSGSGKTKHGFELIKQCKQGIYFVSRKEKSSGYPAQPFWINKFLLFMATATNNNQCEYYWLKLINVNVALIHLNVSNAKVSFESISNFLDSSEIELNRFLFVEDPASDPITIDSKSRQLNLTIESSEFYTDPSTSFCPIIMDETEGGREIEGSCVEQSEIVGISYIFKCSKSVFSESINIKMGFLIIMDAYSIEYRRYT